MAQKVCHSVPFCAMGLGRRSPLKLRVEGDGRGLEVDLLYEGRGFGGAVLSIHPAVLPFNRQRALVADVIEGDDDLLEVDVAAAGGAEVPIAARVGEGGVPAEDAGTKEIGAAAYGFVAGGAVDWKRRNWASERVTT